LVPWHCQIKLLPSVVTAVGVPALQRLVVGAALTVMPLAEPHVPAVLFIPEELDVVPDELEVEPLELVEPAVVPLELVLMPELELVLVEQRLASVPLVTTNVAPESLSGAP
jgi:hypothetical protein